MVSPSVMRREPPGSHQSSASMESEHAEPMVSSCPELTALRWVRLTTASPGPPPHSSVPSASTRIVLSNWYLPQHSMMLNLRFFQSPCRALYQLMPNLEQ